jgi:tetratricopeptide (TPR) repeat protein
MSDHSLELKSETLNEPAGPGALHAAAEMAADLRDLGRLEEAEAVCQTLLRDHPESAETHLALGHCARARGDRRTSLRHFQAAVAADPRHVWAINEAAADLRELGRLAEAEAAYRRLLDISPGHAHGQIGLGYCARQRGDRTASLALFQAAAAASTLHQDAGLQHELVRAKLLRLDVSGAMLHLRRAAALTAHQTKLLQKSLNISQSHFGQVTDEYQMDESLLNVLITLQKLEPAARADVLGYILREAPDSTAAAVAMMVALRQAEVFSRRAGGGGGIPRRVIQFWDSETPPEDVARLMRSWREHNPGHAYHLFNEATARGFLAARFPESVLHAFSRAREPAQKADIFRLAVLAAAGGVYADADDKCLQPIDSIVPGTAELVVYQEDHGTIGNNFIAARPGQGVVLRALEMAVTAVNRGDSDIVWLATGPGLLTRAFGQVFAPAGAAAGAGVALPPGVVVLDRRELFQAVAIHCGAGYKRTDRHWSNTAFARWRGVLGAKNDNT